MSRIAAISAPFMPINRSSTIWRWVFGSWARARSIRRRSSAFVGGDGVVFRSAPGVDQPALGRGIVERGRGPLAAGLVDDHVAGDRH